MSGEPLLVKGIAVLAQLAQHFSKVLLDEMTQHKAVMKCSPPAYQAAFKRTLPECRNQRPDQEQLHQPHSHMGNHLERSQFKQSKPQPKTLRRIELIGAELGSMGISRNIHQQISKQSIDDPGSTIVCGKVTKRNFQLVQSVRPGLVNAWILAGRAHVC